MLNNLYQAEKNIRSIAKRYRTVKYSVGLAILFLMMGGSAFSQEINNTDNISSTTPTIEEINSAKNSLRNSIGDLQEKIKTAREENNKKITGEKLELIQLMEQGNQVVKSPWSSWQFGANYFYSDWRGTYKGKGDKKEKYPFEGIFTRSDDTFLRNIHPDSKHYAEYTSSKSATTRTLSTFSVGGSPARTFAEEKIGTAMATDPYSATSSLRGGDEDPYGLANVRIRQEDIVKVELGVRVKPKEFDKNPTVPTILTPQEPGNPLPPNINVTGGGIFTLTTPMPLKSDSGARPGYFVKFTSYRGTVEEGKSFWKNSYTNVDGIAQEDSHDEVEAGPNGKVNGGKTFNHNNNITIDNNNNSFVGKTPALMYTSDRYYMKRNDGAKIISRTDDTKDKALFKIYFDYSKANYGGDGGGTLTINQNLTIDSINPLTETEKNNEKPDRRPYLYGGSNINTQAFLVGGSRVGSLNNTPEAKIVNNGTINLVGPFTIGFEAQTDTGNFSRTNQKERAIINAGIITDKAEEGYRGSEGLGGLKVGEIKEDGTVVTPSNKILLKTGGVGDGYLDQNYSSDDDHYNNILYDDRYIERTSDIVNNKGNVITKGGYTGYKVGMILTAKNNDTGPGTYKLSNEGTIRFNGKNSIGMEVFAPVSYDEYKLEYKEYGDGTKRNEVIQNYASHSNGIIDIANEKGATIELNGRASYGMILITGATKINRFENKGTITLNSSAKIKAGERYDGSTGIAIFGSNQNTNNSNFHIIAPAEGETGDKRYIGVIKNSGTINVNGYANTAMNFGIDPDPEKGDNVITNTGTINIKGNRHIGLVANQGRMTGVDENTGKYNIAVNRVTNTGTINIDGEDNTAMLSGGEEGLYEATNYYGGTIILKGKRNVALYAEFLELEGSTTSQYRDYYMKKYPDKALGNLVNYGTIKSEGTDNENLIGINILTNLDGANKGTIDLTGKGVMGVYNSIRKGLFNKADGTPVYQGGSGFKMTGGEIKVAGENSIALYTEGIDNKNKIEVGKISSNGGVALYADRSSIDLGTITTAPEVSIANYGKMLGVMFYNYTHTKVDKNNAFKEIPLEKPIATGIFVLNNNVNATVKDGGVAFYLMKEDMNKKAEFLNYMFADTKNTTYNKKSADGKKLNLIMEDGASLFATYNKNIDDIANPQKLSDLANPNILGNRVKLDPSSDSKKYKIEKALRSKLLVDTNVNLDDDKTTYNRLEYLSSWVTVNSGINMTSNSANKVAIFQSNIKREDGSTLPAPKVGDIQVENNGNISLTGKNSTALATSFGTVTNTGNISSIGENGVGIYAADNSIVKNTGTIQVGTNGVGIFGENDLKIDGNSTAISTNKDINITNTGTIKAKDNSTGAYGIYVKNDKTNYTNATSTINNSGNIDFANNKSSVGIYAENSTLTSSGSVSVGKDGVGIRAIKSDVTLNKGNVNATSAIGVLVEDSTLKTGADMTIKDNAIAVSAKNSDVEVEKGTYNVNNKSIAFKIADLGSKSFKGNSGTLNLGDNSIAYHIKNSNLTSANFIDNLTVNSTGKYTYLYAEDSTVNYENQKTINSDDSIFIYGKNSDITLDTKADISSNNKKVTAVYSDKSFINKGKIDLSGESSIGIYATGGTVDLRHNSQLSARNNDSTLVYYDGKNGNIINNTDKLDIGDNSFGFIVKGQNNKLESNNTGTVTLKNNSIFIYSKDNTGSVTNKTNITSPGNENYGIYSSGKVDNYGNIDFSSGTGSIGVYSYYPKEDKYTVTEPATSMTPIPIVTNYGTIKVAKSNLSGKDETYGIGMAAGYTERNGTTVIQKGAGHIVNRGLISVMTPNSIGMYATGRNSTAENFGTIEIGGSSRNIGMYLENGAVGYNYGTITTVGNNNVGQVGVAVTTGAKIVNAKDATIKINADGGIGIYNFGGGIVENYGTIDVDETSTPIRNLDQADTSKGIGGVRIQVRDNDKSQADIFVNGNKVEPTLVHTIPNRAPSEIPVSSIGIYISSSGVNPTVPIGNLGALTRAGIRSADLIIGAEAAEFTNSKYIQLGKDIIKPYNDMIVEASKRGINKWEIYSGSLTWQATLTQNKTDQTISNGYMTKIPYTVYASDKNTTRDTYNFTDGLEQRYGVEGLGSREKQLFNKLNNIGNNEGILLKQAFDEMMGHQYANIHQRVQTTGNILDKEFSYLKRDWSTASKKSNKIKSFGSRGEYKTDTAGVIDYTNNAYGVVYMHENEGLRLGQGTGWYTGFVYNTFKFKDIGRSKEEMLEAKLGVYKSIPFDYNNSLNWTISGDISLGYNKMHRKFLVVDEIFNARGRYNTYGIALKNELGKDFRLSESISIRPYGAIKMEYMKLGKVKEKSGEVRLDVKDSHYTSVRPEVGVDLNYKYILASGKIITARLGTAYEDELGKVSKAENKARVAHTSADWFNLPKEKEDRKGNVKTDFSLGVEGEILGGTANIGYDTKGHNIRAGVGFRVIF
ncbi:autotransporter-associated N-terminal domain-containing protein [Fusobacterium simiae]|uniref:Autotransporter-associated N-terminal domain-containing protein n=1 Tax=Fusobacterium simiae TaxID=855 RepID=A0ABT4DFE5_FUSSI|nr:autotransporter-associated N-terminal domain-containing protein [Fusobacterium simiae]MCY7007319.1 autotransporter-associated N-terminal domain-containing protein [Fusobacterium simiae]